MTIIMKKQDLPTYPDKLAAFLKLPSLDALRKAIKRWGVVEGRFDKKKELPADKVHTIANQYAKTGSADTKERANIILQFFENNGFENVLSSDDSDYKLIKTIGQQSDKLPTNLIRMKNRTAKQSPTVKSDNGQANGQHERTADSPKLAIGQSQADSPAETDTKRAPQSIVFENQYLFLTMLVLICLIDGIAMSTIAKEVVGKNMVIQVFYFIAGAIVAYAALQNAYTLSKRPRKSWETNHAITWIVVFTIFQIILHGAATDSFRTWNDMISQGLISTGIPMATAGLSVLLFHKQTDKS